jgi:hypothetical protein
MIRLSWRQFRAQATVAFGALAVIAVVLAITGPQLVHLYYTSVVPCRAQGDCAVATAAFVGRDKLLQALSLVLVVVPGVIGVFWGAPLLARELETGTYQLAWTQSVPRKRWLAVKLGLVGLASVAVTGLLSLMVTWWSSPIDRVNADPFTVFDQRGTVRRSSIPAVTPSAKANARHRPFRLCRIRLRARRHRWDAAAPDGARDGRHPGGLRRYPRGGGESGPAAPHRTAPHRLGCRAA